MLLLLSLLGSCSSVPVPGTVPNPGAIPGTFPDSARGAVPDSLSGTVPGTDNKPKNARLTPVEGVVLLGVGASNSLQAGINRNELSREFAELIRGERAVSVLGSNEVRSMLGTARYGEMLQRYEASGRLDRQDVQVLMAARLRAPVAIIAQLSSDDISHSKMRRLPLRNSHGQVFEDREQIIMSSQRRTSLTATMVDLRTGAQFWTSTYHAEPVATSTQTRFLGSSFTGSVMARLANTMANGVGAMQGPPPPSLSVTMQSLLREVAVHMPVH